MNVRIVIDSTSDLTPELKQRLQVLPLTIRFGEEEYIDGITITHNEFYDKLVSGGVLPTTSQVTPFAFSQVFQEAVDAGCDVVAITISPKLSGTYQSAVVAAADFPGRVFVVDSSSVTIGAGVLVEYALRLVDEGRTAQQIAEELTRKREDIRLLAVLDTLEYLKKGGRISAAVAFAGGLLSIKPVADIRDGVINVVGKACGGKQGCIALEGLINQNPVDFSMPFLMAYTGNDDSLMRSFMDHSAGYWAGHEVHTTIIGSVVGTHAGPGAYAAAYFVKK